MTEDRRKPGRPRLPENRPRATPRPVRLEVDVDDALCQLSLRHGLTIHALLRLAARRLVADERRGVLDLSTIDPQSP